MYPLSFKWKEMDWGMIFLW